MKKVLIGLEKDANLYEVSTQLEDLGVEILDRMTILRILYAETDAEFSEILKIKGVKFIEEDVIYKLS